MRGLALSLVLWSAAAQAHEPDLGRARTHFEAGKALFQLGNFEDALREFQAGYSLAPLPGFLLNIGQTYRKLNRLDQASALYQRYLDAAPADDPDRVQVTQIVREIEEQRRLEVKPTILVAQPSESPHLRRFRKTWWIIPTAAVVVTGLGVGLYFGLRPSQVGCSDVAFCVGANSAK